MKTNLNKPVFVNKTLDLSEAQKMKIAQDVGRNKEDAYLIQQFCEKKGIDCIEVRPSMKKWNHKTFINLTKSNFKRTNEHTRDAARLVWGL